MSTIKLPPSLIPSLLAVLFVTSTMNSVLPIGFDLDNTYAQDTSSSCSCGNEAPRTAKEALEKSNIVFVGRVTEVINVPAYKQMIFEVGEVWKGEGLVKRDEILLFAPEGDCSFDFRVSELYLVYASYNNENMLTTSTCDRTAPLSEAQSDLDVLGRGYDSIAASAPDREEEVATAAQDDEANTAVESEADGMRQIPLIAGIGAAIAGLIAFITLKKFR